MPNDSARIFSLLWTIGRHMRDGKSSASAGGTGERFSMLHFHTLRYVKAQVRPLMHDVAAYLCVTPPAASLLIEGLVKEGLVRRSFDRKDRRAVRLALTPKGSAFLARGIRTKMAKLTKLFSVLTAKERAAFIAILKKIAAAAERR